MLGFLRGRAKRGCGCFVAVVAVNAMITVGCVVSGPVQALEMRGAYVRVMPPGTPTTAVFGELYNDEKQTVNIVAAKLQGADRVEIHAHTQEEGVMRMRRVEQGLILDEGDSLVLKSGGCHLMVFGFTAPKQRDVPLKLRLLDANGRTYEFAIAMGKPKQVSTEVEQKLLHRHRSTTQQHSQETSVEQEH